MLGGLYVRNLVVAKEETISKLNDRIEKLKVENGGLLAQNDEFQRKCDEQSNRTRSSMDAIGITLGKCQAADRAGFWATGLAQVSG